MPYALLQFIPARGRKLLHPPELTLLLVNYNLSPQGDGNPYPSLSSFSVFPHYNLSPQGDGNLILHPILLNFLQLQFIPARGRKRSTSVIVTINLMDYNLSPQGDGNFGLVVLFPYRDGITIYPRKGTETGLCVF